MIFWLLLQFFSLLFYSVFWQCHHWSNPSGKSLYFGCFALKRVEVEMNASASVCAFKHVYVVFFNRSMFLFWSSLFRRSVSSPPSPLSLSLVQQMYVLDRVCALQTRQLVWCPHFLVVFGNSVVKILVFSVLTLFESLATVTIHLSQWSVCISCARYACTRRNFQNVAMPWNNWNVDLATLRWLSSDTINFLKTNGRWLS